MITELIARGYEVTFVTASFSRKALEDIGASFVPLEGESDISEDFFDDNPERNAHQGMSRVLHDFEHFFVGHLPGYFQAHQKALKMLQDKHPGRPIVAINDPTYIGGMATLAGAKGIRPTATINLGNVPIVCTSVDTAPFGPGLAPDSTPAGHERNKAMNAGFRDMFAGIQKQYEGILTQLGSSSPTQPFWFDCPYALPDRYLQMCTPGVEYVRSDLPPQVQFAGILHGSRDAFVNPPSWWTEVIDNKSGKKIVAVSQGSANLDYVDLTIPALEALKNREDLLVIVALGKKGGSLPKEVVIPDNARVADWIPFDDLLPHCAAFLSNGGYGGFLHAVSAAAPILIAGETEDHPEVAARAEWSGMGFNFRTQRPAPEAILKAVDEVISDPKYKKRALELQAEAAKYDPMTLIVDSIEELAVKGSAA